MNLTQFRKDIISGKIDINHIPDNDIEELKHLSSKFTHKEFCTNEEMDEYYELIMILLDIYTYREDGFVVISDYDYDLLMNNYIINGGKLVHKSDVIEDPLQTRWKFVKHEAPGVVGTIKKIYDEAELYSWCKFNKEHKGIYWYRIAPKFDGISSAIKLSGKGEILQALTRNDGYEGQDITKVIRNCRNVSRIEKFAELHKIKKNDHLWIKTELVMDTECFEKCIQEKPYANRRSATSGIVNSPKNVHLAKYLDIIPLAVYNPQKETVDYIPLNSYTIEDYDSRGMMHEVEVLLSVIRNSDYPYRTDGVVLFPLMGNPSEDEKYFHTLDQDHFNPMDIMDDAIAFKVNTNEAITTVEYGYVSVGPLGYARPMIKVRPVEVNETTVTDVSLGSFDTFATMDLHEKEEVIVFSAGDVIPQAKLPESRHYKAKAPLIKIKKQCPYCNEKLTRSKGTYRCENEDCPRVNQGKIINFITKMDIKGVAEATIEDLYNAKLIKTIPDIFELKESDIIQLEGYQKDKANLIISEFQRIKDKEIPISKLLGALGIKGISRKKCQLLMKAIADNPDKLLKKKPEKMFFELTSIDGIGDKTAATFIDFLKDNHHLIADLMDIMNVSIDPNYIGNVVFTGFRDSDLQEKFEDLGYELSNRVNSETVVVINASYEMNTPKCRDAIEKNISIVHRSNVDVVLDQLSKRY